jgi:XTP/dITP diphosphohydrolase
MTGEGNSVFGMRELLVATKNRGKLLEIFKGLGGVPFEILNLADVSELPDDFDVEEPAMTFEGNAIIKAMTVGCKTGKLTLAEDTGLEVDALDGRPGVLTARYATGTDEDRYTKLLKELEGIPDEKRIARFRTVVAVFDPETFKIRTTEGELRGTIIKEPSGTGGFGYDPIFFVFGSGKTLAEVTTSAKNCISHRGKAIRAMREILLSEF